MVGASLEIPFAWPFARFRARPARPTILCALAALALAFGAAGQTLPIPGDLDGDADVDAADILLFAPCMSGSGVGSGDSSCQTADFDADGDVDQSDFGLLQRCLSGSTTPANPGCVTGTWQPMPGDRNWARQALAKECNYIADCSFTELATHHSGTSTAADGYGVLNDNRIYQSGPDWVRPGEAAMGAVGLMAAAQRLHADSVNTSRYEQVLDRFFQTWLVQHRQPVDDDAGSVDQGAIYGIIQYDSAGRLVSRTNPNAGVTGQTIVAMWKYGEFLNAIGASSAAELWLQDAWPMARDGGEFIARNVNAGYSLVRSNSTSQDLWITDSVFGAAAMRALGRWSVAVQQTPPRDYEAAVGQMTAGLRGLADTGGWKGFFRYRAAAQGYNRTYGDQIDQLCFLPYDSDVLDAGEAFAGSVSDFWTDGNGGANPIVMTPYTTDSADWRFFGTFLHHYFDDSRPENRRLSPGAGLQLARMEWRHAVRSGDAQALQRAWRRFVWVADPAYSGLWWGGTESREAGVGNGIVDWRLVDDKAQSAQGYERFLDTSAYFAEVILMLYYGTDTSYLTP